MNGSMKAGLALLAVCIAVFCCCAGEGDMSNRKTGDLEAYPWELGTFEGLSADTEWRILQDYYTACIRGGYDPSSVSINDLRIINYYGTYNGYVVVGITGSKLGPIPAVMPPPYIVADIRLASPPIVWNNRQFYGLRELYDSGLLSYGDIETIAKCYYPKE
jgi:hypothetical protein